MSDPVYACELCHRSVTVVPSGRGFPPRIAKGRLEAKCAAAGCSCKPRYRAGVQRRGAVTGQ